ncbi:MAG: PEP-CTERM sorting domain-containing protein [Verrucomicrobia bacterium]|nr:MAG: PEP-CTERM sorting domain-containing protein [Verrucomicrobiota bacterium]
MGHNFLKLLAAAATLSVATSSFAGVVYQMAGDPNSYSYTTAAEYGDEVILAGTERVITGFSFHYYANYTQAGAMTFRIYAQDGPLIGGFASPGSLIDSRSIDVISGGKDVSIDYGLDLSNVIPSRLTYTVEFAGLTPGNQAGLIAPGGSPVVGLSGSDFWEKTGSGANDWALKVIAGGTPTGNFIATITAVPEPGTVALMLAGAGLLLAASRRK